MTAGAARIRIVPHDAEPTYSQGGASSIPQARPATVHNQWADVLERRAQRCAGCGEWAFTAYCDWCLGADT